MRSQDATKKFKMLHAPSVLPTYGEELCIGKVGTAAQSASSDAERKTAREFIEGMGGFGGEPALLQSVCSRPVLSPDPVWRP